MKKNVRNVTRRAPPSENSRFCQICCTDQLRIGNRGKNGGRYYANTKNWGIPPTFGATRGQGRLCRDENRTNINSVRSEKFFSVHSVAEPTTETWGLGAPANYGIYYAAYAGGGVGHGSALDPVKGKTQLSAASGPTPPSLPCALKSSKASQ